MLKAIFRDYAQLFPHLLSQLEPDLLNMLLKDLKHLIAFLRREDAYEYLRERQVGTHPYLSYCYHFARCIFYSISQE